MSKRESTQNRQDDTVARQYDGWARVYDLFWRRYVNQTVPVLQRAACVQPGERVLDVACGTGAFEQRVAEQVPDVDLVGVDLAPSMVERARDKLRDEASVRFEKADAHDLPFNESSFDAVVCANTFHYFTHPETVLEEADRVLRPGGRLVLLDWCRDFWTCQAMDAVLKQIDPAYHTCYTLGELTALTEQTSLQLGYHFRYRFDLVWGMMVIAAGVPASE